jgi:predicted phosphodiesterase
MKTTKRNVKIVVISDTHLGTIGSRAKELHQYLNSIQLDTTFKKGDKVHRFTGSTYGCISYSGVTCSVDGKNPFFELPANALIEVDG